MGTLNRFLDGTHTYQVTAAAVVARQLHGERYLYRGAVLPTDTDPDQIRAMLEQGLIRETGTA